MPAMQPAKNATRSPKVRESFPIPKSESRLAYVAERFVIMAICSQDMSLREASRVLGICMRSLRVKLRQHGFKPFEVPSGVHGSDFAKMRELLAHAKVLIEPALTADTKVG